MRVWNSVLLIRGAFRAFKHAVWLSDLHGGALGDALCESASLSKRLWCDVCHSVNCMHSTPCLPLAWSTVLHFKVACCPPPCPPPTFYLRQSWQHGGSCLSLDYGGCGSKWVLYRDICRHTVTCLWIWGCLLAEVSSTNAFHVPVCVRVCVIIAVAEILQWREWAKECTRIINVRVPGVGDRQGEVTANVSGAILRVFEIIRQLGVC